MTTNPSPHPALIDTYFALAGGPDIEAYVALFASDTVVHDDGTTRRGLDEVRDWREEVPSVAYRVESVTPAPGADAGPGAWTARTEISGDFPGSPVTLDFAFELESGLIRRLTITP
jgi:hypothetical protein